MMVYYAGTGLIFSHYISEAVSWLDHVECTGTAHKHVLSCDTLAYCTFGDHISVLIIYYCKQGDHVKNHSPMMRLQTVFLA